MQVLFGDAAEEVLPDRETTQIALGAVRVKGVPELAWRRPCGTPPTCLAQPDRVVL